MLSYVGISEYAVQDPHTWISRWMVSLTIWLLDTRTQIILCTLGRKSGGFLYPCGFSNREVLHPLKSNLQVFSSNLINSPCKFMRPSLPLSSWFQYLISWFYKCDMHAACTFLCPCTYVKGKEFLLEKQTHFQPKYHRNYILLHTWRKGSQMYILIYTWRKVSQMSRFV